jgi:hypothetical protein
LREREGGGCRVGGEGGAPLPTAVLREGGREIVPARREGRLAREIERDVIQGTLTLLFI